MDRKAPGFMLLSCLLTVHRPPFLDRVREQVAVMPHVHLAVLRDLRAQHLRRLVHRYQAPVRVFPGEHGLRLAFQQDIPGPGLDPVAADDRAVPRRCPVREVQHHVSP